MKATLTFEDRNEAILAIKGIDYHSTLWDLDEKMRQGLKHDNLILKTPQDVMGYVRSFISDRVNLTEIE